MKSLFLLCTLFLLTGCASNIENMDTLIESKAPIITQNYQEPATKEILSNNPYEYYGPENWDGVTLHWAVMDIIFDLLPEYRHETLSRKVEDMNNYLALKEKDYRIAIYATSVDNESEQMGREFYQTIKMIEKEQKLDLFNTGYRNGFHDRDNAAIELLLQEDAFQYYPPGTFSLENLNSTDEGVLGIGDIYRYINVGVFTKEPLEELSTFNSLEELLSFLLEKKIPLYLPQPIVYYFNTPSVQDFIFVEEEPLYFWESSEYKVIAPLLLALREAELLTDNPEKAQGIIDFGFSGQTTHPFLHEDLHFYPLFLKRSFTSPITNAENLVFKDSPHPKESLDFLQLLDQDKDFIELVLSENNGLKEAPYKPEDIYRSYPTRLVTESTLFPNIKEELETLEGFEVNIDLPLSLNDEIITLIDELEDEYSEGLSILRHIEPGYEEWGPRLKDHLPNAATEHLFDTIKEAMDQKGAAS